MVGQVVAYEAGKSITVEVKRRGGQADNTRINLVEDHAKIELVGEAREIAAGIPVSIWLDKNSPPTAIRIVVGASSSAPRARRPNNDQAAMRMPAGPTTDRAAQALALTSTTPKLSIPQPARQPVAGLSPAEIARQVDQHVESRLTAEKLTPSPPCDDAEFIRRAYLEITGVIPPADKVVAFLDSPDRDKRTRLIDELLSSPDYGRHFADLWCDRINLKDMPIYREPFIDWMSDSLNRGRGWDQMVFELLTAGGNFNFITRGRRLGCEDPQALLVLLNTEDLQGKAKPNPAWLTAESCRLFLGVQLQCAECHNHPFTPSWKQTDFWGLAAFYGRLGAERGPGNAGLRWIEAPMAAGEAATIAIPPTALKSVGAVVPSRLLSENADQPPGGHQLLRHALAHWMTLPENPYFAQAASNRLWAHFFGHGLVNPIDDLRPDNPPTHPVILALLAEEFKKSQFDLKHLIRCLCLTQAYQRTSQPLAENAHDQGLYSHMAVKTLSPGVFYDSLKLATGWPEIRVGLPENKTKLTVISKFTPREVFVDFFRAAQGEEANPLENNHGIPQALKLMNAAELNSVAPLAQRLSDSGQSREQAIEQMYLAVLSRHPDTAEATLMANFLSRRSNGAAEQAYSAILWTLINSAEFISNH